MLHFTNYPIDEKIATQIQDTLNSGTNVTLKYDYTTIASSIRWTGNSSLTIISKHTINIARNVTIANIGMGTLKLMPGIESEDFSATVNFDENGIIDMTRGGKVEVYYNPSAGHKDHKYHNTKSFHHNVKGHSVAVKALVNNIQDLEDMSYFPSGSYALSRNIDASSMLSFEPISNTEQPFTGDFDGNNYEIANLHIDGEDNVSIFGIIFGTSFDKVQIKNLQLRNITVKGENYVGVIASEAKHAIFTNIHFTNIGIKSEAISGGIAGSAEHCNILGVSGTKTINIDSTSSSGKIFGGLKHSISCNVDCQLEDTSCVGLSIYNSEVHDYI
ncbi:MAG: hypothetical protein KBC27_02910 [Rickettsiales bacterium]|nr:hypothetical protein [Rickettsiales bacterium]